MELLLVCNSSQDLDLVRLCVCLDPSLSLKIFKNYHFYIKIYILDTRLIWGNIMNIIFVFVYILKNFVNKIVIIII